MNSDMTLILAAWNDWIMPVVVVAIAIGSVIGNIKKKSEEQRKRDEGPGELEIGELAARRREQLRQTQRTRAQTGGGSMTSGGGAEPGNMTMAERIARARAKAQYEQRAQASSRPTPQAQPQVPNEAQRRALAQRRAELQRRQQAARAQQQSQQRQAQDRARQQARQKAQAARRQRAQAHARAQARARQRGTLIHDPVVVPGPTESTTRRVVPDQPKRQQRIEVQRTTSGVSMTTPITGGLSRADLRRAILLNEVLGKPRALEDFR